MVKPAEELVLLLLAGLLVMIEANAIGEQDQVGTSQGLYNSTDLVTVLNATNFRQTVYGSDKVHLVEFYNSWCGFCQRFALIWKKLAESAYGEFCGRGSSAL